MLRTISNSTRQDKAERTERNNVPTAVPMDSTELFCFQYD